VDIELERTPNVLVVSRDSLVAEGSGWVVYRKGRLSTEKVKVEIGALSDTEVSIKSGLSAGDVIVRNPLGNGGKP
jgi:multidrug efflux pump subunit AcrA (membrane-fusion protein)